MSQQVSLNSTLVGVLLSQSASPSVVCLSSPRSTYLGFLTEVKPAAILITPSFWGSQRAGYSPRTRTISCFPGAVAGEEVEDFYEGSFRTHILYFVIVLLYFIYFTCIALYQKPKKIRILGSCYFFTLVYYV
jgi:hypothetical protein